MLREHLRVRIFGQLPWMLRSGQRIVGRSMNDIPNCSGCGCFTTGTLVEPVRDPIHPYTADYAYYCARCAEGREAKS